MWKTKLQKRLAALEKYSSFKLYGCNINKGISDKTLFKIVEEAELKLPEEVLSFYREMDGLTVSWSLDHNDEEIYGSIIINSLKEAIFGYYKRVKRDQYENAFEDILWNDSFLEKEIKKLKPHRLFESIEGDASFITFKFLSENIQLFYVYEAEIKPLQVSFTEYLELIIEYVGAGYIRDHLISKKWQQKVMKDKSLNFIENIY